MEQEKRSAENRRIRIPGLCQLPIDEAEDYEYYDGMNRVGRTQVEDIGLDE